jgi:hypothetical protein
MDVAVHPTKISERTIKIRAMADSLFKFTIYTCITTGSKVKFVASSNACLLGTSAVNDCPLAVSLLVPLHRDYDSLTG